jgi:hypothetical protein
MAVMVHPKLVIGDWFGALARAICAEVRSSPNGGAEDIVFPDKPGSTRVGVGIMMRDVIADRQERPRDYIETQKQAPPGWVALNKPDNTVDLWLSGCIVYKYYGFDEIHTTGFSLSVKAIDSIDVTGHKFRLIDPGHWRTFKASEILLEHGPVGSFAD